MEKIYVEEKNNQKSSFKEIMGSKVPHHLSALMILVAFASFVAMQFSGNSSYAIMYDDTPQTFKTITASNSKYRLIGDDATKQATGISPYFVPYMLTETCGDDNHACDFQVFCLNKGKTFPVNASQSPVYTKTSKEVDPGIVYIISKLDDYFDASGKQFNEYTRTWITQTAIWKYQEETLSPYYDNYFPHITSISPYIVNDPSGAYIEETDKRESISNVKDTLDSLVAKAKTIKKNTITITKTGEVTVTSDNKYYKSPLITVSGFTSGGTYSLTMNNVPDGTKLYREDGTEIKDIHNIDVTKFYVLVPINKVTEKTKKVTLSITGPAPIAYEYTPSDDSYQTLTILEKQNVSTGLDLEYTPVVPDTGLSTAQSIYFIGLVVLLCGLGIIYANTKSKVIEE